MGKVKNRDDVAFYTLRLNLTHPDQLEVHQFLQKLNKNVYKSQNAFVMESVQKNMRGEWNRKTFEQEPEDQRQKEHLTWSDMEQVETKVYEKVIREVMKEVFTVLYSALAGKSSIPVNTFKETPQSTQASVEVKQPEDDEVLASLSENWS